MSNSTVTDPCATVTQPCVSLLLHNHIDIIRINYLSSQHTNCTNLEAVLPNRAGLGWDRNPNPSFTRPARLPLRHYGGEETITNTMEMSFNSIENYADGANFIPISYFNNQIFKKEIHNGVLKQLILNGIK